MVAGNDCALNVFTKFQSLQVSNPAISIPYLIWLRYGSYTLEMIYSVERPNEA